MTIFLILVEMIASILGGVVENDQITQLAQRIAIEAPGCPIEGKLAVAWVSHNRNVWDRWTINGGWADGNRQPTTLDYEIAASWSEYPDPTDGAIWLLGPGDAQHPVFRRILKRAEQTLRVDCPGDDFVAAYRWP